MSAGAVARLRRFVGALGEAPHPLRFLVSRALYHSGLAPGFTMTRAGIRYRFWPSSLSMSLWADPAYASWDRDVVRAIVRPGDTVVDVGANVGFVSLEAARAAGAGTILDQHALAQRFRKFLRETPSQNRCRSPRIVSMSRPFLKRPNAAYSHYPQIVAIRNVSVKTNISRC